MPPTGGQKVNLSEININDLDFSNIANWPFAARIFTIILIAIAVLGLGYRFDSTAATLDKVEKAEADLKAEFETKARKAANLEAYEQQLEEMRQSFGAMLRQLPTKPKLPFYWWMSRRRAWPAAWNSICSNRRPSAPRFLRRIAHQYQSAWHLPRVRRLRPV